MNKAIRKAVFPVAGFGTRFLPATKAHPKEMMAIVDKPLIQYAVEEAIEAGATEMIFVTNSAKRSIEDHFDSYFELETRLEQQGKTDALEIVRNIIPGHVRCVYIRQPEPRGLGHALLCAKSVIGDEPFAVLLADDLIQTHGPSCLTQMVRRFEKNPSVWVAVEKVLPEEIEQYGIVSLAGELEPVSLVQAIIEKPKFSEAPSQFGVVGRYIFEPRIFDYLEKITQNNRFEIDLSSAIQALLQEHTVYAYGFEGNRFDCGSKIGYLKAILSYGLNHPDFGTELQQYLETLTTQ